MNPSRVKKSKQPAQRGWRKYFSRTLHDLSPAVIRLQWRDIIFFGIACLLALMYFIREPRLAELLPHTPSTLSAFLLQCDLLLIIILSIRAFPLIRRYFQDVSAGTWLILLGLLCAGMLVKPFIPHTVWHSDNIGIGLVAGIRDAVGECELTRIHGFGYQVLMQALYVGIGWGHISVLTFNYLLSLISVVLLFLWSYALFKEQRLSLIATMVLLFLPVHLKLAATECTFIIVELFLLMTLLWATLYNDTREEQFLWLTAASFLYLVHMRIDMLILASLMMVLFAVLTPISKKARAPRRGTLLLVGSFFILALIPRLIVIYCFHEPRLFTLPQQLAIGWHWLWSWPQCLRLNVLLDNSYTPWIYPWFFLFGAVTMLRREWRKAAFLLLVIGGFSFFYLPYWDGVSTYLRTGLATQAFCALVIAYGLTVLIERIRSKKVRSVVTGALLAGIIMVSLGSYWTFIQKPYATQEEFAFLQKVYNALPAQCTVVYLAKEDDPQNVLKRDHVEKFLSNPWRHFIGLREFMQRGRVAGPIYYYRGAADYKKPIVPGRSTTRLVSQRYLNPLSDMIGRRYTLRPLLKGEVHHDNLSTEQDVIVGERAQLGLYQVVSKKY